MSASAASALPEIRFDSRHPSLVVLAGLVFGSLVVGAGAAQGPLAGAVALVAVAAAMWAVSHPTAGALAVVAIVPAISGGERGLPIPGLRLGELLAIGFAVMLLTTTRADRRTRWRTFDWVAFAYVVATFALGFFASELRGDTLNTEDVGQLVGPLGFFLLYRAMLIALPTRQDRVRAVDWLLIGSVPVSIITLLQTLRVPGMHELLVGWTGMDWSDRAGWAVFRANGPFPHHTNLSAYLAAIVIVCAALLLAGVVARRRRLVLTVLALGVPALIASLTFAPMAGAVAGALILAIWYRRVGRVLAYGAIACVLLAVPFQSVLAGRADEQFKSQSTSSASYSLVPATVTDRIGIWTDQYLPVLRGRWLWGYGPQIPQDVAWTHTESIYLTMLLRGGLPLLLIYAALMGALALLALDVGRRSARAGPVADAGPEREEQEVERGLARALFALIVVLTVTQLIAPVFTYASGLPHVFWIGAALVVGAAVAAPEQHSGLPAVAPRRRTRSRRAAALAPEALDRPAQARPKLGSLWSETGVVLSGNVLARGLGFVFPILLAHAITKSDFGTVYFFIGTGFFVSELVVAGFPTAMTRFMAAEGDRGAWLSSALAGGLPLLVVSLAVGETLAVVADAPPGLMWMVVVGLTLDAYYFSLLRGLRSFKLLAGYRVSANLAQLVLLVGVIAAGLESIEVVVAIYSFVYLLPMLAIEVTRGPVRRALHGALRPTRARVRQLTKFALPALVSGTAYAALINADVLFVQLLNRDALPDYAAAKSLAQPMLLVPYAIAIVMLPAVAAAEEGRRWRMLVRALGVTALLGVVLVGAYVAGAVTLIDVALPESYSNAADVLPLLAAGLAAIGVYSVLSQWWMGIGRPGPPALALTFGALVAIGLQYALTPAHGGTGAALAIAGGVVCALVVLGAATARTRARPADRQPIASR